MPNSVFLLPSGILCYRSLEEETTDFPLRYCLDAPEWVISWNGNMGDSLHIIAPPKLAKEELQKFLLEIMVMNSSAWVGLGYLDCKDTAEKPPLPMSKEMLQLFLSRDHLRTVVFWNCFISATQSAAVQPYKIHALDISFRFCSFEGLGKGGSYETSHISFQRHIQAEQMGLPRGPHHRSSQFGFRRSAMARNAISRVATQNDIDLFEARRREYIDQTTGKRRVRIWRLIVRDEECQEAKKSQSTK